MSQVSDRKAFFDQLDAVLAVVKSQGLAPIVERCRHDVYYNFQNERHLIRSAISRGYGLLIVTFEGARQPTRFLFYRPG